jgi:hypothetical protein
MQHHKQGAAHLRLPHEHHMQHHKQGAAHLRLPHGVLAVFEILVGSLELIALLANVDLQRTMRASAGSKRAPEREKSPEKEPCERAIRKSYTKEPGIHLQLRHVSRAPHHPCKAI